MNTNCSLDDLAAAKAELQRWDDAYVNDSSNNPNKYEAQRRDARRAVRRISEELKSRGVIEKSEVEKLTEELDRLYPNAQSKTSVVHNGVTYQIRYFPVEKSRSRKSVNEWGHQWVELGAKIWVARLTIRFSGRHCCTLNSNVRRFNTYDLRSQAYL